MGVSVDIQSEGVQGIIDQLDTLETMLQNGPGQETMLELGQAAMQDVDARFDTGGYGTWAPLAPITIIMKGGRDTILIDTGNMRNAVGIGEVTANRVTVVVPTGGEDNDPSVPIAHQLGISEFGANAAFLPQRKIVEISDQLLTRLAPIIKEWHSAWRETTI